MGDFTVERHGETVYRLHNFVYILRILHDPKMSIILVIFI